MRGALVLTVLLAVTACGGDDGQDTETVEKRQETSEVEAAYDACDPESNRIELGDDGHTIIIGGVKDEGFDDLACFLDELDTPESIVAQIDATTAMMGRQHADADGIKYDWSYHPDNGVNMVITDL